MCSLRSRIVLILAVLCVPAVVTHAGPRQEQSMIATHTALLKKQFVPQQLRTQESDEAFRKNAPPLGSVRLSNSALAFVKSFMRQVRRATAQSDQIASIVWAREQRSKGPSDADWKSEGPGWVLGAYSRTQVPPDVIDKVRGIEIVFSAEEPSSLVGKTIDIANKKLFVRE
jgi:hypothetical protein